MSSPTPVPPRRQGFAAMLIRAQRRFAQRQPLQPLPRPQTA